MNKNDFYKYYKTKNINDGSFTAKTQKKSLGASIIIEMGSSTYNKARTGKTQCVLLMFRFPR